MLKPINVKLISYLFYLHLLLAPYYVFSSGLPQPADIIIVFTFPLLLTSSIFYYTFKFRILKLIKYFVAIVFIVNGLWSVFYLYGFQIFWMSSLFYLFNAVVAGCTAFLLVIRKDKFVDQVKKVVLLSVLIQVVFLLIGIGGRGGGEFREVIFFNNPNQLGYFVLLSAALYGLLNNYTKKDPVYISILFQISAFILAVYSASRATVAGIIVMAAMQLIPLFNLKKRKNQLYIILFGVSVLFFLKDDILSKQLDYSLNRRKESEIPEYKNRGYDRIIAYPELAFFGAGEGSFERFEEKSFHTNELHSAFGTVLFSYGLIGMILFTLILNNAWKAGNFWQNTIFIFPVLFYNLTHQGLRASQFWVLLVFMALLPYINNRGIKRINNLSAIPKLQDD